VSDHSAPVDPAQEPEHDHAQPPTRDPSLGPDIHVERWEGIWLRISAVLLFIFVVTVTIAAVAFNIQVPGVGGRVDPNALDAPGSPFANPGVRELAPGKVEVYMVAQAWAFTPNPVVVPQDAEVTFYVTSRDIQHGFKIMDTNINMMILPGQISTLKTVFHKPGTHNIICHEYCGIAHQTMYGQVIVEPPGGLTNTVTSTVTAGITTTVAPAASEAVTATESLTATRESTATGAVTTTSAVSETGVLTGSAAITGAVSGAAAVPLTATSHLTGSVVATATGSVTATSAVTTSATVTR